MSVWIAGITTPVDFALGCTAFLLLFIWQVPPWLVVIFCAAGGFETRPYNRKTACHQSAFLGRVSGISLQTSATPAAANAARARNAAGLPK
jgi:hypothetical protein